MHQIVLFTENEVENKMMEANVSLRNQFRHFYFVRTQYIFLYLECLWSPTNFYKSYFFNVQLSKHEKNCNIFSYSNEQNVANDFVSCVLSWLESDQLIVVLFTHTCPSLPPPPVRYGRLLKLSGLGSCRCHIYNLIIPAQLTDI